MVAARRSLALSSTVLLISVFSINGFADVPQAAKTFASKVGCPDSVAVTIMVNGDMSLEYFIKKNYTKKAVTLAGAGLVNFNSANKHNVNVNSQFFKTFMKKDVKPVELNSDYKVAQVEWNVVMDGKPSKFLKFIEKPKSRAASFSLIKTKSPGDVQAWGGAQKGSKSFSGYHYQCYYDMGATGTKYPQALNIYFYNTTPK